MTALAQADGTTPNRPEHTPGPWRFDPPRAASHYDISILAEGAASAVALACDLWGKDGGALTRDANACLIAAAPDVLAALKALHANCTAPDEFMRAAEFAIALAEGRKP
jgi:hypothetical protein